MAHTHAALHCQAVEHQVTEDALEYSDLSKCYPSRFTDLGISYEFHGHFENSAQLD